MEKEILKYIPRSYQLNRMVKITVNSHATASFKVKKEYTFSHGRYVMNGWVAEKKNGKWIKTEVWNDIQIGDKYALYYEIQNALNFQNATKHQKGSIVLYTN